MSSSVGSNRILIAIPIVITLAAVIVLASGYAQTGEWFQRSIDLKGGTLVSVTSPGILDIPAIESRLSESFGDVVVRELSSFSGNTLTVQVETGTDPDAVLEALESMGVDTTESSVQTTGSSLGESFWIQAQISMVVAFLIMGIIVFAIFRTVVPSAAVIAAAVSDIVVTLALMQVFSIDLSLASFAALLMLIGYSIDTDIMLTTRVIRNTEDSLGERIRGAFRTGMTMTVTTLVVLGAIIITSSSAVLLAIASVLFLGLVIDIINTWLMNAGIIRWYAERRGL